MSGPRLNLILCPKPHRFKQQLGTDQAGESQELPGLEFVIVAIPSFRFYLWQVFVYVIEPEVWLIELLIKRHLGPLAWQARVEIIFQLITQSDDFHFDVVLHHQLARIHYCEVKQGPAATLHERNYAH